ncbi:PREDICTED: probable protein ABIL1 isoform X1 [Erythranthe guttata]|uniref:probable protein ABIL1 isoform X1 n=1 Tax=Erythranthe guttata TaxID=4155 RepID=UPI00064DF11F|nr:PREDICTED: probable protein ABIL1 isoform X1 [Erythranthe guttata]|eukprot:XP_012842763.1 PREDICTED: probable protein ABIL1 isoform X1 [Erythranthe guttata]
MPDSFDAVSFVDNETEFDKSMRGKIDLGMWENLQELRKLSSQLYNAADYCERTFMNAEDKKSMVETTKAYISKAVVTVVDHLGSISSNLESCIADSNSVLQTEHKMYILKLRIGTCLHYSHKLALPRFYWNADPSRHHRRYILPPSTDSLMKIDVTMRDSTIGGIEAKIIEKEDEFETEEPLFLHTYNCKPSLVDNFSITNIEKRNGSSPQVVPVRDGLSILPKAEQSTFQFQEVRKLKRSMINWKVMQNKDIASLIRRGKRILA